MNYCQSQTTAVWTTSLLRYRKERKDRFVLYFGFVFFYKETLSIRQFKNIKNKLITSKIRLELINKQTRNWIIFKSYGVWNMKQMVLLLLLTRFSFILIVLFTPGSSSRRNSLISSKFLRWNIAIIIKFHYIFLILFECFYAIHRRHDGVMGSCSDWGIGEQSSNTSRICYLPFRANNIEKGMKPLLDLPGGVMDSGSDGGSGE